MLIAVHEEPLIEFVSPAEMSWTTRQRQAWATLVEARDSLAPEARITVQSDVLIWRALRHVARRDHRDLLVVGSGRDASDGRVRLGERAAGLFDHLECPLAIVPRGMRTRQQRRLERIGVGYQDEPEAIAALELARSIALAARAELAVRSVIDDRTPVGVPTEDLVPVGESIVENQTRLLMDQARAAVGRGDAPVRLDVSRAKPADALSALGTGVDLLVIGSRRSGPAGRISLGSTGSDLANGASCPILVVPRPPDAAAV
jgi:nucleotide-binding universal stress UspA family protein